MHATMTLAEFHRYTRDNRKRIADIYREIEEVQYRFNDLHTKQSEERHKLIATHAPLVLEASEDLPGELARLLHDQEHIQRKAILEEIAELESQTTERRQEADRLIEEAQRQIAYLREQNPILDKQEEQLKARRASLEAKVRQLDATIKQLSWFPFGSLVHFARRRRLQKQHAQLADNVNALTRGIRTVREKWQIEKQTLQEKQDNLRSKWQALIVEAAQLQVRLDYLSASVDEHSRRNAAQRLLRDLKELPCSSGSWESRLAPLAELNRSRAVYEIGLTTVAEILGLLKGLLEGMNRFMRSVATVYEEQRRYRLPPLTLKLSAATTSFHAALPGFQSKVKDEKYLGTHPLEFGQRVQDFVQERLHETAIREMFKDMGDALNRATEAWH